jgi:acyl carrier protein
MTTLNREAVLSEFTSLIGPYVRRKDGEAITEGTHLVSDLNVNSARLVDIVLETEDRFNIRIDDAAVDRMQTIGDAVDVILEKSLPA